MMAKVTMLVWSPQFVVQKFGVDDELSGQFMSNVFASAFVGSIIGSFVVSKIKISYFLYSLLLIAPFSVWLVTKSNNINTVLLSGCLFGISISATFNAYIAYGLNFVRIPTPRHIAYLLLIGSFGSTLAPYVSSKVVENYDNISSAINLSILLFLFVIIIISTSTLTNKQFNPKDKLPS